MAGDLALLVRWLLVTGVSSLAGAIGRLAVRTFVAIDRRAQRIGRYGVAVVTLARHGVPRGRTVLATAGDDGPTVPRVLERADCDAVVVADDAQAGPYRGRARRIVALTARPATLARRFAADVVVLLALAAAVVVLGAATTAAGCSVALRVIAGPPIFDD